MKKLLISFRTMTDALHAEETLTEAGLEGRLIPLPAAVRSDCGMGWMGSPEDRDTSKEALTKAGITPQGFHEHETRS